VENIRFDLTSGVADNEDGIYSESLESRVVGEVAEPEPLRRGGWAVPRMGAELRELPSSDSLFIRCPLLNQLSGT